MRPTVISVSPSPVSVQGGGLHPKEGHLAWPPTGPVIVGEEPPERGPGLRSGAAGSTGRASLKGD